MENVALELISKTNLGHQLNWPSKPLWLHPKSPKIKCQSNEVGVYFYMQQCMSQKDRIVPHGEGEMEGPAIQAPLGKSKQLHHSVYNLTT